MLYNIKHKLLINTNEFRYMYIGIVFAAIVFLLINFIYSIFEEFKRNESLKDKILNILKKPAFIGIIYTIIPIIMEILLYKNYRLEFSKDVYIRIAYSYVFCMSFLIYFIFRKKDKKINRIVDFIVKHRYKIAIIAFVVLVVCKIHFSSIGIWNIYTRNEDTSTIFGKARAIRSDEWLVTTPYNFSQEYNSFKLVNENLFLGNNDMNIFHAPVLDASIFVRIFSWGYILFGNEIGLSWAWTLKFIVMFMIYFELGMMISKKDKGLSILLAFWLTFSPAIMWWSMMDTPAFAIAIIVLFHTYVSNKDMSIKKKLLIAYGMTVFLCNFAFSLYPAWQVPLGYLILPFIIIDFIIYRKNLSLKDYLIMIGTIIITAAIVAYFVITSWNGIQALMGTKYPGARECVGGEYEFKRLINYYTNFFSPYTDDFANPCEISAFIYPSISVIIVIICEIISAIKNKNIKDNIKNKDNWYLYGLIALILIFLSWMKFSWPTVLRKVTLFYNVPEKRLETIFQMSCVILTLAISVKLFNSKKKLINNKVAIIISIGISALAYYLIKKSEYVEIFTTFKFTILLPIIFFMNYTFLSSNKKAFIYVMILLSLFVGGYVNPISRGVKEINQTEIAIEARKISEKDPDAIWIGESQINAQYLGANGIKVLNGINQYPNYEWIDIVDPKHKNEEVWNRYAHIAISFGDETKFDLVTLDSYILTLTYDNLKDLNIKYLYSYRNISEEDKEKFGMETIYEDISHEQYIYKINF
ncbi:MAG: hypothetical protein IKG42_05605 [Clostridia bacterium]|nr:hypothetical protein [Clostridia bacterium]